MVEPPTVRPVENRRHSRYQVSIPADCSTPHLFFSNHVCNISKGGLFIQSNSPLPLNEQVSLVLHLPGVEKNIFATGRVIWNHDESQSAHVVPGSGIRFVGMTASDRAALESYMEDLTPGQTKPPVAR
jgi:type IV pilus assembly protein PilZ